MRRTTVETAIPGLGLVRRARPTPPSTREFALHAPALCIVVQGAKQLIVGRRTFDYGAAHTVLVAADLPVAARIVQASPALPYLCIRIDLDFPLLSTLAAEAAPHDADPDRVAPTVQLTAADPDLLDAATRVVRLLDRPMDIPILAPLASRELAYRLLGSAHGPDLRQRLAADSATHRVDRAIVWLKRHYTQPLRIAELAQLACMGPTMFHQRFKAATAMTPMQYQKQLRLQQARALMLAQGMAAAKAAFQVGYESPTQFSREYRRMFGLPPARDIADLRQRVGAA